MEKMIKIFITGLFLFVANSVFSQLLNYQWQDDNNEYLKISILIGETTNPETGLSKSLVVREMKEYQDGVHISPYRVHFYSEEIQVVEDYVELDLTTSKYLYVPFNPFQPIVEVTEKNESGRFRVSIKSEVDNNFAYADGHWVYICSCGSSVQYQSNCHSRIGSNGVIGCASDGSCGNGCPGWMVKTNKHKIKGGGIFVKVDEGYEIRNSFTH